LAFEVCAQLTFRHDLAFVTATLTYAGVTIEIADVLVDTGAASTIINADLAAEGVFTRRVDRLAIGDRGVDQFEVEVGEMDYGFEIGGILGMDFLRAANAVIDLGRLTIEFA
jgi:predicted aspartyl protease